MKTRKRSTVFLSTLFAAMVALVLSTSVSAQGRYSGRYSRGDVDSIIKSVEDNADEFRRDFDNELNRSNLSSSQKRTYRNQVESFENATDRLRSNFNSNNTWWTSRNQVQAVVSNAAPLNNTMNAIGFRRNIERQWNQLRNAVNRLADTYDLPGIAGGGWTGGGGGGFPGGGGGQTSTPPNWAQGTFYSSFPSVTMTISRNGQVTSVVDGQSFSGRYYNGSIYSNGEVATVTRSGNGIRTYNRTSGVTINFNRGGGGGGGFPGGSDGPTTNPPNWARGSFRANNVRMTISSNGRVTTEIGDQTYYGRYYNGSIYSNGEVATVTRSGNGIRTYNRTSGVTLTFRRD